MHLATLGFLETLQDVLKSIFDRILLPVLTVLFEAMFNLVVELIKPILASIYYQIMVVFLKVLDFLAYVFDIFAGVRPVNYHGTASYFLDIFFGYDPISKAFFYITVFAAVLAVIFTIYSVVKSVGDMTLEDKNPVGAVLRRAFKAAVIFMMIPLMTLFLLRLSSVMLVQVSQAISGQAVDSSDIPTGSGEASSLGSLVFLSGSMKAANNDSYNSNPSYTDALRVRYLQNMADYSNVDQVKGDFDLTKYDYITSTCSAIVVSLIMIGALFMFIRRVFDLLILYLVSPVFVATIPLDDGGAFSKWRELFVAKMFSGFGTVIAMKLFFLFVPMLFSSNLKLNANSDIDAAIKLFIIIGGAWAAFQSQTTLLHLLSPEAAYAAQESVGIGALVGGMAMRGVASVGGKIGGGGKKQSGGGSRQSGGDMESYHRQRQSEGGGAYAPQGAHSAPGGAIG
jgi:hypothetical protein